MSESSPDDPPAESRPGAPSPEDARARAEVERIGGIVRRGLADLPAEIEPAHFDRWFVALAARKPDADADG